MPAVINDDALTLGPCNLYKLAGTAAFLETALVGADNDLRLVAKKPGTEGNSITLTIVDPAGNNVPLSVSVTGFDITVTAATDGTSTITSTADDVINALNADPGASALLYAVRKDPDDGSGVVTALASTPLASGSDTLVEEFLGALGEETAITISTEATPLTAAQSGTLARKKVVTGGKLTLLAPLKEMTLDRFAVAVANSELIVGDGASPLRRLEFKVNVGQDLRRQKTIGLVLKRLVGANQETTDPEQILTIPEASAVDAEVELAFNPTTQQQINATFEAWPDSRGVLAYFGTAGVL